MKKLRCMLLPLLTILMITCFAATAQAAALIHQTKAGETSVTVSWDKLYTGSGKVQNYEVSWGDAYNNYTRKSGRLSASTKTYTIKNLAKNSPCYVGVTVYYTLSHGTSSSVSFSTKTNTKPSKVTKYSAYDFSYSGKGLRVAWEAPKGGNYLKYQYQIVNGSGKPVLKGTTSLRSLTLSKYKYYNKVMRIRVRAFTTDNYESKTWYGPWSAYKALVPQPILKNKVDYKNGKVTLHWSKVKGAKKYILYLSKSRDKGYKKVATVKGSKKSKTLSSFKGRKFEIGPNYYVKIVTVSKYGKSNKYSMGSFHLYRRFV